MSNNLQHSKETTKTFNIQKLEQNPSTSLKAKKNLQHPRVKTKAFNL
jgi:hypothetical protein